MNAKLEFREVFIGRLFHFNGNDYIKMSSRTARMLNNGRTFYIGKDEFVHYISYQDYNMTLEIKYIEDQLYQVAPLPLEEANYPFGFDIQIRTECKRLTFFESRQIK